MDRLQEACILLVARKLGFEVPHVRAYPEFPGYHVVRVEDDSLTDPMGCISFVCGRGEPPVLSPMESGTGATEAARVNTLLRQVYGVVKAKAR